MKRTPTAQARPRSDEPLEASLSRQVARQVTLLRTYRLPDRYRISARVFDDCGPAKEALVKLTGDITAFIRSRKLSTLIFYGMPDTLRQFALGHVVVAAALERHDCLYLRASEVFSALIDGRVYDDERTLIEVARDCSLLALDDLGRENVETANARVALEDLLAQRFDAYRKTLVGTSLTLEEIGQVYGPSFARMLRRQAVTFTFTGTEAAFPAWAEGESLGCCISGVVADDLSRRRRA